MTTQVLFLHRPPSAQWEPLVPDQRSGMQLWVWFRPAHLPTGLVVSVPDQVVNACPDGLPFTLADILNAAGVPFQLLGGVSIFGAEWQPPAALLPLLNHALPSTSRNGRFEICVQTMVPGMYPSPMPEAYPAGLDAAAWADAVGEDGITDFPEDDIASGQPLTEGMMFERIESAWKVCLQVERQLQGVRQKLSAMIAALGKLDRELTPDERVASDREDRDSWSDSRRWLRDLSAKCHRELKQYDIGVTSGAGRRHWMEDIYTRIIQPRVPNQDLEKYQREFEGYRRDVINLQKSMVAALQAASQNGTQRAHRVLGIIAGKIRERRARNREALGGMNIDKSCRSKKR